MRPPHDPEPKPEHGHPHEHGDDDVDAVLGVLRADGGRITTGRRAIVRALYTAEDHHLTAEGIAALVQADHPEVHLSTIYRTLESLERLGVVDRLVLGPGGAVYHLVDHAHHHLVCDGCGLVLEVPEDVIDRLVDDLDVRFGFALSGRPVTFAGRCRACR